MNRFGAIAALLAALATPARADTPEPAATSSADEPAAHDDALLEDPAEVIEIWDERPDKPFERDTELRLTGEQLAEAGVNDLAEALALVPELHVRDQGRGGVQVNIRGGRRGAVKVLIDGVPVDDAYYGNFDVSSIPVTDIAQIRVSLSPSSPIDGAGGPAGVIEVHTRDAVGARLLYARGQASDLPAAELAVTGRAGLTAHTAARSSAQATLGMREFEMADAVVDEGRRAGSGALRLEYRRGDTRVVADGFVQHRAFVVPPGTEEGVTDVLAIDAETSLRGGVLGDAAIAGWRVRGHAYAQSMHRESTYYRDPALTQPLRGEVLDATRLGTGLLANRPLARRFHVIGAANFDSESADVQASNLSTGAGGRSSVGELAAGLQYAAGTIALDLAAGAAVPVGVGAGPWAEGKLGARYTPASALSLELTLARKGRVPTLRELYRPDIGNDQLAPEVSSYAEVAVELRPAPWARARAASYVRDTTGMIRFDGERAALINLDGLTFRGTDLSATLAPTELWQLGASYSFIDSAAEQFGSDSLDFLPRHRAELWWHPRLGARASARVGLQRLSEQLDRGETLPAFTTVDVTVYARLGASFRASLRIDNVANERYPVRSMGVLAPGRVMSLGLTGAWE